MLAHEWSIVKCGLGQVKCGMNPRSTAEPLFSSQYLCGTTLLTLHSMVWDWWVLRAAPMRFHWPKLLDPFFDFYCFSFFFLSVGWYCGVGVFGLIKF